MDTRDPNHPARILVVDDEPAIRNIVAVYLQEAGLHVTCASNGLQGFQLFKSEPFDLVITDRDMPEMNGEELATGIRHIFPSMPLILISGHRGLIVDRAQFDAFLPKPFTRQQLWAAVKGLLSPLDRETGQDTLPRAKRSTTMPDRPTEITACSPASVPCSSAPAFLRPRSSRVY